MTEEWRPIPYPAGYEVSDLGRVRRTTYRKGYEAGRVLRPHVGVTGYPSLRLSCGARNAKAGFSVHRIVCEVFHGPPPTSKHEVGHWNGHRSDNRASNLRWVTPIENHEDAVRHGTFPVGEKHANAKCTETDVAVMREMRARGVTLREIGALYGMTGASVGRIFNGVRWAHLQKKEAS